MPVRPLKICLLTLPLLAAAALVAGCSSGAIHSATDTGAMGPAFVVGTDAPLANVVSFNVGVTSVAATDANGNSVALLSSPQTVDFARFNGLQTLLDINDVPQGTYKSVTITLNSQNASVGYLNTGGSGAPTITNITNLTFTTTTVTANLGNPLVVTHGGAPVGLRIDFDLAQSLQIASGATSATVDPTFNVSTVARTDAGAHIDEYIGAVTTAPSGTSEPSSFIIAGPHGEQFTIDTTSSTEWDGGATLASLNANSIVAVAGKFDPADQTLDADEVALISDMGFYASGLVTYVTPTSGAATSFDFYTRAVLPDNTADQLGDIAQVNLTGNETYGIYWMHNQFTNLLFNSSALAPGQDIFVGGTAANETNLNALTVGRIHLRDWGYNGTIVAGSQSSSAGTFQMQVSGFAGALIPSTITVYLGPSCDFRFGFSSFGDLSNGVAIRVVGLLLKNSTNGNLVLLARHLDGVDLTNMTTAAWQ